MCGTCAAFCDKIRIEDGEPGFIEDYDTVCGLCYTFCPRTFLPQAEIEQKIFGKVSNDADVLGVYRACYEARTKKADIRKKSQDGGIGHFYTRLWTGKTGNRLCGTHYCEW